MANNHWTIDDIGELGGRVAIVTGANSGIGFETARALVRKGARVILACRSERRGEEAAARIRSESPAGDVTAQVLDLGDLGSVRRFAGLFLAEHDRLDILVANAGVMMPPHGETRDGFELQLGVNHLGHFALVGLLMPRLLGTGGSRVVVVSSLAHKWGGVDLEDPGWKHRPYDRTKAYGQSKLANLLFTYELQRRLDRAGSDTLAVASHPGWTATNLQRHSGLFRLLNPLFAMKPWQGALPTLYAATSPDVEAGGFYGPDGMGGWRGWPARAESNPASHDEALASGLWDLSEELTGVRFEGLEDAQAERAAS